MKFLKDLLIYTVPFVLIVGTNFNLSGLIGINIAIGYSEFVIFLLLICLLIDNKVIFPKRLIYAFLSYLAAIILSLIFSSRFISIISIIELIRWIEYFILFVCIYSLADRNNIYKSLYLLMMASIWFISTAVYQTFTFNFYEKRIYGTFLSAADIAEESVSNPNVAGAFLVGCFLFFYSFKRYDFKSITHKYCLVFLQNVSFVLVLYTLSRSAFIGMILGLFVLLYFFKKNIIKTILFIFCTFIILFLAIISFISDYEEFAIIERAISTFDSSTNSGASVVARFENSSTTLDVVWDNFVFGIGFGDLENQFNLVPDNYYIHNFAETGIVGFVTSAILLIVIFLDLLKMKKSNIDSYFFYFICAFIAFYVSFLFENYAANLFRSPRLLGLFWFVLAIIYKYYYIIKNNTISNKVINE
ncbi:O-antigen ligase family protein [Flavobacterium ammonificans]|uniref:O-antigen ligase family protein n=1 Tax=Flavobacterium ammonificans TaxID=1751056 RepID=UPI001E5E3A47|nr:O-antigen ligase family protein [Flavobacterium ammonificans]